MIADLCLEPIAGNARCQLFADHLVPHTPDPDGGFVPLPTDPWNEIVPRLWQGGSHTGDRYYDPLEGDFDSVLTLYRNAPFATAPVHELRYHFNDDDTIPSDGLSAAVAWVYNQWAVHRRHVLVRCQGGLNRSGLVIALVLHQDGHDITDVIRLLRERRSPYALCNTTFAAHLEQLA